MREAVPSSTHPPPDLPLLRVDQRTLMPQIDTATTKVSDR
jgi:hypothetical protein